MFNMFSTFFLLICQMSNENWNTQCTFFFKSPFIQHNWRNRQNELKVRKCHQSCSIENTRAAKRRKDRSCCCHNVSIRNLFAYICFGNFYLHSKFSLYPQKPVFSAKAFFDKYSGQIKALDETLNIFGQENVELLIGK